MNGHGCLNTTFLSFVPKLGFDLEKDAKTHNKDAPVLIIIFFN